MLDPQQLDDLIAVILTGAVAIATIVGSVVAAYRKAVSQADAHANGKIRELAGSDVVEEYTAKNTPHPDKPIEDRAATGLIGLAVRRELQPLRDEQARQGSMLKQHGELLDLLIEESDTLQARAREHSDEIESLRDTLDGEEKK